MCPCVNIRLEALGALRNARARARRGGGGGDYDVFAFLELLLFDQVSASAYECLRTREQQSKSQFVAVQIAANCS